MYDPQLPHRSLAGPCAPVGLGLWGFSGSGSLDSGSESCLARRAKGTKLSKLWGLGVEGLEANCVGFGVVRKSLGLWYCLIPVWFTRSCRDLPPTARSPHVTTSISTSLLASLLSLIDLLLGCYVLTSSILNPLQPKTLKTLKGPKGPKDPKP